MQISDLVEPKVLYHSEFFQFFKIIIKFFTIFLSSEDALRRSQIQQKYFPVKFRKINSSNCCFAGLKALSKKILTGVDKQLLRCFVVVVDDHLARVEWQKVAIFSTD